MRFIRSIYYKLLQSMSNNEVLHHYTGFGLYDKVIIDALRAMHDPLPHVRAMLLGLGFKRTIISYVEPKRRAGKSSYNLFRYYSDAMVGFTSQSNKMLRLLTIVGFIGSGFSFLIAFVYLIYKLLNWQTFNLGIAPAIIGIFLLESLQLFFLGFIGEYVMAINIRTMDRPLVLEEERINFDV
jgi:hypothetical protein